MNYLEVVSSMIYHQDKKQLIKFLKQIKNENNHVEYQILKEDITNLLLKNNLKEYIQYL